MSMSAIKLVVVGDGAVGKVCALIRPIQPVLTAFFGALQTCLLISYTTVSSPLRSRTLSESLFVIPECLSRPCFSLAALTRLIAKAGRIYPDCVRQLFRQPHGGWQTDKPRSMGYSRARRLRPTSTSVLPSDGRVSHLLLARLSSFF